MPLFIINIASTVFYIVAVLFYKHHNETIISISYFEIIFVALLSELLVGAGKLGYVFFVFGMISGICYLFNSSKRKRHQYQLIGSVVALLIYVIYFKQYAIYSQYKDIVLNYSNALTGFNLCISLFTITYISALYITELNQTKEELSYSSNHDLLTGLYNRRFFEHIIHRNQVEMNNEFSVAMIDIDDFKKINDSYGHEAGDKVLATLSTILNNFSKEKDYLAVRWGGEEFILYLPNTGSEEAYDLLQKISNAISADSIPYEQKHINITITIGLACGQSLNEYQQIIKKADENLYIGKNNGKNCIIK